jgi:hypothetical protein
MAMPVFPGEFQLVDIREIDLVEARILNSGFVAAINGPIDILRPGLEKKEGKSEHEPPPRRAVAPGGFLHLQQSAMKGGRHKEKQA